MDIQKLIKDAERADAVAELMQDVNPHHVLELAEKLKEAEAKLASLAKQEPVAWRNPKTGNICLPRNKKRGLESSYAEEYKQYCEPVFTRAATPAPVVVKAPEFKVHAQHPTMAAGMRDNDWKEAIKAAGGSVADE